MTQELNERLAKKAGWMPGQDYGPAPSYVNSIDAQVRDLDPLVEKKWGGPVDGHYFWEDGTWYWCFNQGHSPWRKADGTGPHLAAARAAAIDQALKEEERD